MARIHPELLEKIRNKLGISRTRVYELIADKAGPPHYLSGNLAAIQVAAENGISINRYVTEAERDQLRGGRASSPPPSVAPVAGAVAEGRTTRATRKRAPKKRKSNSVMVVYGRDKRVNDALDTFLRTLGLVPIEWSKAVRATGRGAPYVGQILDTAFGKAAAVVVLLTPDDEASLKKEFWKPSDPAYEKKLTGQARPNVLFEAGRAFGSHPDATVIVQLGHTRPFSDTGGVHVIYLDQGPECRRDLASRLERAGCAVDDEGTAWLTAGDFSAHGRPPRKRARRR